MSTGRGGRRTPPGGGRMATRVKTAKGRKPSSTRWLQRQLNDPYVAEAQRLGYRSRAAFKLIELDNRFHFLAPGKRVLDLGAAPGGWTQVAVERTAEGPWQGPVIAADIQEMLAIPGAEFLCLDILDADAPELLMTRLGGPADVVLSDMAPSASGHAATDHLRIVALVEAALEVAIEVLAQDGVFVAKVLQGGTEHTLLARMKRLFANVRHAKPPASRDESSETYVVAQGFRG